MQKHGIDFQDATLRENKQAELTTMGHILNQGSAASFPSTQSSGSGNNMMGGTALRP
jgi:hypothetical protein